MNVTVRIPLRTKPEGNGREHWRAVAKRRKAEHNAVGLMLAKYGQALRMYNEPLVCTMTRVSAGTLDSDNLQSALKGVRDAVAKVLGVDDGGDAVEWRYRQDKAQRGTWWVVIEIAGEVA
jgi:hypothetical protein